MHDVKLRFIAVLYTRILSHYPIFLSRKFSGNMMFDLYDAKKFVRSLR